MAHPEGVYTYVGYLENIIDGDYSPQTKKEAEKRLKSLRRSRSRRKGAGLGLGGGRKLRDDIDMV